MILNFAKKSRDRKFKGRTQFSNFCALARRKVAMQMHDFVCQMNSFCSFIEAIVNDDTVKSK